MPTIEWYVFLFTFAGEIRKDARVIEWTGLEIRRTA